MTRKLHYTDAAADNLVEIARYIATQSGNREIARRFVERLREKCRQLASLPGTLGTARPELHPDIRSTPYQSYVIFFRYLDSALEIVNVLEAHRDIDGYYGGGAA